MKKSPSLAILSGYGYIYGTKVTPSGAASVKSGEGLPDWHDFIMTDLSFILNFINYV